MRAASAELEASLDGGSAWFWAASNTSGRFSLLIPLAISALAIVAHQLLVSLLRLYAASAPPRAQRL